MRKGFIAFVLAFCIASMAYAMDVREVSNEIVKDCSTDEQKLCVLREAVYKQMRPGKYPLQDVLKMSPEERWDKGVGWCNHQVHVFMMLAAQQGFSSRMIYLLTKDMGTSPHTVANVLLKNRWVVIDVGNNIEFRNKYGELATANDMSLDFTIVSENERVKELKGEFPTLEAMEIFTNSSYLVKEIEP